MIRLKVRLGAAIDTSPLSMTLFNLNHTRIRTIYGMEAHALLSQTWGLIRICVSWKLGYYYILDRGKLTALI